MSPKSERYLTVALAALFAAGLLWLAVPRTVAAFVVLPADRIAKRLYERMPVDAEQARRVIETRRGALRWVDDPSYWVDLSRAHYRVAAGTQTTDGAASERAREAAAASAVDAAARSPAQPWPWVELAQARQAMPGASAEAALALSTALLLGPDWPGAAFINLDLGLQTWPILAPEDRSLLLRQARVAWRISRQHYVGKATTPAREAVLRIALATDLRALAQFEHLLRRTRKPG